MESDGVRHSGRRVDPAMERLVDRLNSLRDGDIAVADLVENGEKAVEPLRRFLLFGRHSGIYRPRQRAVEALAALGAKDVLLEYLSCRKNDPDPVDRYGEEAVENTAARLLAHWRDEDVYGELLRLLRTRALPGLIDAVGSFRRSDTIPELIRALGDSVGGPFAENSLRLLGAAARKALLDAARTPRPSPAKETPSSRYRRRSALRLLADLDLPEEDRAVAADLMRDSDPEIAARACRIALPVEGGAGKEEAIRRLLEVLPEADAFLRMEAEDWLRRCPEVAKTRPASAK